MVCIRVSLAMTSDTRATGEQVLASEAGISGATTAAPTSRAMTREANGRNRPLHRAERFYSCQQCSKQRASHRPWAWRSWFWCAASIWCMGVHESMHGCVAHAPCGCPTRRNKKQARQLLDSCTSRSVQPASVQRPEIAHVLPVALLLVFLPPET